MSLTLLDLVAVVAGNGLLLYLLSKWLEARLQASIQHEYAKKLEDYRNSIRIREQATRVVDLLVHVIYAPKRDDEKFVRLVWELALWLPAELVWEVTRLVCGDAGAKDPKEILVAVRRILLQDPSDELKPEQIAHVQLPPRPPQAPPAASGV